MRNRKRYTMLDDIGIKTAAFTVVAATDLITSNSHGLKNGDMVVLTTSGTLPAGMALTTVYHVIEAETNTFKLAKENDGFTIDITDTGSGTQTFTMHDIGRVLYIEEFRHVDLAVDTDGGGDAALTLKFQVSSQETAPDFSAAQSKTNQWDFVDIKDLEDGSSIDGDTGFVVASADDHRVYEVNINAQRWLCAILTAHSAGEVTVKALLTEN